LVKPILTKDLEKFFTVLIVCNVGAGQRRRRRKRRMRRGFICI